MWFGTPEGLTALSKGSFHSYGTKDGLPSVNIDCLLEDSAGLLWVGTEQGLALKDLDGFRTPLSVPASAREQILSLAEDGQGWLWISTSRHILRVKRDSLLRDRVVDGDVREYGMADGLRGTEGRKGRQSVVVDRLGRVWISLNRGISSVNPARLARDGCASGTIVGADGQVAGIGRHGHAWPSPHQKPGCTKKRPSARRTIR